MADETNNGLIYSIDAINVTAQGDCHVTVNYGLPSPVKGQAPFMRLQVIKVPVDGAVVASLRDAVAATIAANLPSFLTGATPAPVSTGPRSSADVIDEQRKALGR